MNSAMHDAARYWGALNRLRSASLDHYTKCAAHAQAQVSTSARFVYRAIAAFSVVWITGWTWLCLAGDDSEANILGLVIFDGIGIFMLVVAAGLMRQWHAGRRGVRHYATRDWARASWRQALAGLAERYTGTVETAGIARACRFLEEHHPERAPILLMRHQGGAVEEHWTLTGQLEACPLLVQIIDFMVPGTAPRPPVLLVLVVCPMELPPAVNPPTDGPFRTSPPMKLEETATHHDLVEKGLLVRWTAAGAYALHPGPADALLNEASMEWVANTLLAFCRSSPTTNAAPAAPANPAALSDEDATDHERVLEAFLQALRDHDALGALAHAHPQLFPSLAREPTPEELDQAIDAAHARPIRWERTRITSAGAINRYLQVDFVDRASAEVAVYLTQLDSGRWTVCGYTVSMELVLGIEFVDSG